MLPILLSVIVISLSGVMAPGPMFAVTLAKSYGMR
jgi:threonine/homoserine/homoserine lactone efflux protein